ncbi:response regulator [Flavobacterium sp. XGLA_31]|uniref:response regulator n=1 Tax=Flavobacterium sp. XGLA_31 TaxID=3447666 RepID=UPI003F303D20
MRTTQTIYYLDDDIEDVDFFKEVAESLGHIVKGFTDGGRLLMTLELKEEKPDLIFLDVHMPILNGQEILEVIKRSDTLKHIPIVMVSGAYPKKLVRHFSELGVNYLMKKSHVHDYKAAVEEVLNSYFDDEKEVG